MKKKKNSLPVFERDSYRSMNLCFSKLYGRSGPQAVHITRWQHEQGAACLLEQASFAWACAFLTVSA